VLELEIELGSKLGKSNCEFKLCLSFNTC